MTRLRSALQRARCLNRTGQDRTGQDRTGQDRTGQDESSVSESDNLHALNHLLSFFEQSTFTQRDKGTKFEQLCEFFFKNDSAYKGLFSNVQTYAEWAADQGLDGKDIGIDLVCTLNDGSFAAVQCKFYQRNSSVSKSDIDSFISASEKRFAHRFLVATNERWSGNSLATLQNASPAVTLITLKEFENSDIDWKALLAGKKRIIRKKLLRGYQKEALDRVISGFKTSARGKLLMACGTGKTFTSLRIAEQLVKDDGGKGLVLFLVPSLALVAQTISEWTHQTNLRLVPFAVCSDSKVGQTRNEGDEDFMSTSDLPFPPTTDPVSLARKVSSSLRKLRKGMVVIFSTYQSIDVIHQAQTLSGESDDACIPPFSLIISDEAHRTASAFLKNGVSDPNAAKSSGDGAENSSASATSAGKTESESPCFVRVHDDSYVHSRRRLYMTATPKVFGVEARKQAADDPEDVVIYSMDDEKVFGPTFYEISFGRAVSLGCLVDYKVIILTVPSGVAQRYMSPSADDTDILPASHAAKVIGCWRSLSKLDIRSESSVGDDLQPMRRAVAFAQRISMEPDAVNLAHPKTSSRQFAAQFTKTVEAYIKGQKDSAAKDGRKTTPAEDQLFGFRCETKDIDGGMNAVEKQSRLDWLRGDPGEESCRILFNVRCLSEGVDVPSLDAVIFLSPRKSQVDIVQTVGRVMRKAPGKKRGYVIIPLVVADDKSPEEVLERNKEFSTVWQVLTALKSIDPNSVLVDGTLKKVSDKIEIIAMQDGPIGKKSGKGTSRRNPKKTKTPKTPDGQGELMFDHDEILEESIRAKLVRHVGNRREWADWAGEVGEICQAQAENIRKALDPSNPANAESIRKFRGFKAEIAKALNDNVENDVVIEMLSQHIVIRKVISALFSDYPFAEKNPISSAMTTMLEALDSAGYILAADRLKDFYSDVERRCSNIKTLEDRQKIVVELFNSFFKLAFPKQQEKYGIVYTPIPIVDFIDRSVSDILKKEFGESLADDNVHILDPFTGTGTFITRLMQLIPKERLPYKYWHELHAHEIMPLAYYIAAINIESEFYALCPDEASKGYQPNKVAVWTDTFAARKKADADIFTTDLIDNQRRIDSENDLPVRVIIGNPPYSVGQKSQNDDNQNDSYPELDARLQETYVANTNSTLRGKLFDSYIRAYRWASDRIGDRGVIGFVTNAGWIDSASADGMRKCMEEEFSSIYIYHLKGNQRTSGEESRRQGGKVFGSGSRAPVAIVILVKNPDSVELGKIYFHEVADYITAEEKLDGLNKDVSVLKTQMQVLTPNDRHSWLNQENEDFYRFFRIDGKKTDEPAIFENYSCGVVTARDVWVCNSSTNTLNQNVNQLISFYNGQVELAKNNPDYKPEMNPMRMKWDRPQLRDVVKGKFADNINLVKFAIFEYRPFFKQNLYYDRYWNNCVYQMPSIFPTGKEENRLICVSGVGSQEFSVLMTGSIPCLDILPKSQCFPLYLYDRDSGQKPQDLFSEACSAGKEGRHYAITDTALTKFRTQYQTDGISKEDIFYYIYGLLHSEDYRKAFANNLMKDLPRIPLVPDLGTFRTFTDAGRSLADLHVNYESVEPYEGVKIDGEDSRNYRVEQLKYGKIPGKTGNAGKDKSVIVYNGSIVIRNIPLEAQEYVVNRKSALDWLVERIGVSVDKDSGIVNDFNKFAEEKGEPRYCLDLILRVITVSLETLKIVRSLPHIDFALCK